MNFKKEKKKADDLYQKSLTFLEHGQIQESFQAIADSVLIYKEMYKNTQKEDIFETFLIYWKKLIYICVSVGLFKTKKGLIQIFQLIIKDLRNNWALLRVYNTAIEIYANHLQLHYKWRTNNKIDPNYNENNEKQIKSLEKLLVESSEAGVKLGELLIEDSEHRIKVLKMLQRYYTSLIPFCKNEQKKKTIVENINIVLNKLYDIKNPSFEVLNIIAITEINFALALYAIGKNQDAYEHYINGVNLSKKENLVEALKRAETVSKDEAVEKFLINGAVGKFGSKEEEIELEENNIIPVHGLEAKYGYLRRDPYKDQILQEQSRQLAQKDSRNEIREYMNNIALSINEEYNKLKKYFPSICKVKMYNRVIFYLKDKKDAAARAFLENSQRKIISYQELKQVTRVFDANLSIKEKRSIIGKNRSGKLFKNKENRSSSLLKDDDSGVFSHSGLLRSISLNVVKCRVLFLLY